MPYRSLDADAIVRTLVALHERVCGRFPGSGLSSVCAEVLGLAREARARSAAVARPLLGLRVAAGTVIALILALLAASTWSVRDPGLPLTLSELVQFVESAVNDAVLIGAAIFFLVTLETRIKRRRALKALHELRSIAHIIDMHQLTKDPDRLDYEGRATPASPRLDMDAFALGRYLDYCSELLSLLGKIAALYVQKFDDPVAVAAVNEVEDLTTGLSRKVWQKIMILQARRAPP